MKVLAKTLIGKEFLYSRNNAIQIPDNWNNSRIESTIQGINKHFNVKDNETYYLYEIDKYDNVYPDYKAFYRQGKISITRI